MNHPKTTTAQGLAPYAFTLCLAKAVYRTLKQQAQMFWLFHFNPNTKTTTRN